MKRAAPVSPRASPQGAQEKELAPSPQRKAARALGDDEQQAQQEQCEQRELGAAADGERRDNGEQDEAGSAEGVAGAGPASAAPYTNPALRRDRVPLGVWDGARQLVYVRENKGKHVNRMGFNILSVRWLLPEEAAFLVSDGEMDLAVPSCAGVSAGAPLEPHREHPAMVTLLDNEQGFCLVYEALASHGVELVDYYAYVALKKLRFNVFRVGEWNAKPEVLHRGASEPVPGTYKALLAAARVGKPELLLRYDSFSPSSQFSVNLRGTPPFQVATSRPGDRVPPIAILRRLSQECEARKTKLRVCIFDGQAVSFVQVEDFQLQDISLATKVQPRRAESDGGLD
jgi:hypothetical protein